MQAVKDWMQADHLSREALAEALGITKGHLNNILCGYRKPSLKLCLRFKTISHGKIRPQHLRAELNDD